MTLRRLNNVLKKIMEHNNYKENWLTVDMCDSVGIWTPVDLICREYYNNGCGSAKGFLGITPEMCEEAFDFIRENNDYFVEQKMLNKDGYNNSGFPLWYDYKLD